MKKIAILGSTGSIGKSTLDVVSKDKEFKIEILVANKNLKEIIHQIKVFNPKIVILNNYKTYLQIKKKIKNRKIKIFNDLSSIKKIKNKIDYTISAIPGIAGLEPTLEFVRLSKEILIANKESIICGWSLLSREAKKHSVKLTSIDSEHYSISQIIKNYKTDQIETVYITASGGPFLKLPKDKFKKIKPSDAIKHPKWKMGKKISIDSSTMVNKVLEVSEAFKLFSLRLNQYKILIHPESLIHAIVKLKNGLSIFLFHQPDMKIPISNALNANNFFLKNFKQNNNEFNKPTKLNFEKIDLKKFPVVEMINKINEKESSLIVFNAANEVYVDQFLKNNIDFTAISRYLNLLIKDKNFIKISNMKSNTLNRIKEIDALARSFSFKILKENQ
ncbi:MAG: 1-deoxy-D-xylulose-5-phosphate reductoisomerase [Pelagibacteraceae bacterium]